MKQRHLLLAAALLLLGALPVVAQMMEMPPIPVDKAVRTGKLPNGLTYFIRQNGYPENRVNFYIAQRVGSIQEEEDQRGLAHFLEHMAFNGSEHYPASEDLLDYLRSIGVEFGADLNAYTAVDQTVYHINNVPSGRESALDSCLLVLKDWSNGLLLTEEEIDKERGVIHEEWRLRTGATMRILERNLESLYPGSKYGRRFPIGLMDVVDNFEPKALRDYYAKWYRPDNQAIIVVGDIDVDRTEEKIKELFTPIPLAENAAPVVDEPVPDNEHAIILVDKDKEQPIDIIMLMFKHEATPDEEKAGLGYLLERYAMKLICSMVNERLKEIAQDEDCPFVSADVDDGQYIYAKTVDAFEVDVLPKEGRDAEAVAAAMREVMRAVRQGFTATEYQRAKDEYLSALEKTYTNRDKRDNNVYGNICAQHFLANEPMPSIEDEYMIMQQVSPMLPVEMVNEMVGELIQGTDANVVVLGIYNEKEGREYPTTDAIKAAIDGVHAEELEAWVDDVRDEPLIDVPPVAGRIVGETEIAELGCKALTLSNGARVILKKTDFQDDQVILEARSRGGSSLYGEEDIVNAKVFDQVIGMSGIGNFSSTELTKALAGKQANADLAMQNFHESVSGHSTPKDMETMFQMAYLYFTKVNKDEKSFGTLMNQLEMMLRNKETSPDQAFADSVAATVYGHNPRFSSLELKDLERVDYDRILRIAGERTANAADFTFTVVGNFDEDAVRPLIETYIASLPADGSREDFRTVTTCARGNVVNRFTRKMETPKANTNIYWINVEEPYTLENEILASVAGQVLEMIYLQKIREDAGAAYSAMAAGFSRLGGDIPFTALVGVCPVKPEMCDEAVGIMLDEASRLGDEVDADMVDKVKELMLKRADENARKNAHWAGVILDYEEFGIDRETDYKRIVSAVTPEKVAAFVRDVILAPGNVVTVVMLPEE